MTSLPNEVEPEAVAAPPKARRPKAQRPRLEVQVLAIEDLMKLDLPAPEMLIEGVQLRRGAQLSIGAKKSCKTIMGVQKAIAVASGKPFLSHYRVLQQGGAMIVEQDDPGGAGSIKTILQKSGIAGGIPLFVVPKVPFTFGSGFNEWLEEEITDKSLALSYWIAIQRSVGREGPASIS